MGGGAPLPPQPLRRPVPPRLPAPQLLGGRPRPRPRHARELAAGTGCPASLPRAIGSWPSGRAGTGPCARRAIPARQFSASPEAGDKASEPRAGGASLVREGAGTLPPAPPRRSPLPASARAPPPTAPGAWRLPGHLAKPGSARSLRAHFPGQLCREYPPPRLTPPQESGASGLSGFGQDPKSSARRQCTPCGQLPGPLPTHPPER